MTWHIKPSLGNVLVEPLDEEEMTPTGLYLPQTIEKETHVAEVVEVCEPYEAVAHDRTLAKAGPIYAKGDLVLLGKYNGREVKIRLRTGEPMTKYIVIRETDILATLTETPDDHTSDSKPAEPAS